ncbi:beta-ketoacyl-ACP synthase II [Clostridium algidicarnis]|uniref:beta-ketoacyl-ACP synthase II n=1 Tax=Clostridium algidicarnis TaxID=37659 RepID=UPI001C0C4813|nr:beta-ketoacyl-ACP synthase II [Clostridium algidicarnis]MBU3203539.1 beta-ketoacyl-ACP synthase II [Clostridium algidicarnis]MBU3211693.1 beta-ketoacyl-ACP synthase II [Clostridium algidicarnis]MBU3221799.1 beta-ketoacyl-ACP synthase II [Clostridium algidicarnis]
MKRVVITGMGAITPIGNNVKDFWASIKRGQCGIDFIKTFDTSDFKVKLAGEVKNFKPEDYIDAKQVKRMDRFCQLAMVASKEAVEDSKLNLQNIDKEKLGVIVGCGIGGMSTIETQEERLLNKGPSRVSPMLIPMIISNMAAGNIAIEYGAKALCNTIVTACASGTNGIGEAFHSIKLGMADIIIAGGTEAAITPLSVAGFISLTALTKNQDKNKASIPFDKNRDGFVMGEGAGMVVLESLESAEKRGAKIYAEVVGYGTTCDAYHITSPAPNGEGAARAIKMALKEGNIKADKVSYINAHGTSTPYNDKFETAAIKSVFGEKAYEIPVSSTKSMTGHLLGAAGAIEAIICVKAIEDSFVPPTIGYTTPDEECDLDYVPNKGRKKELEYVLSNSLGFGGHNAVLLFKKWSGR